MSDQQSVALPLSSFALLWVTGLYLRLPILVAAPLSPQIAAELALSQTQIGALTTLPVLMLALGALPGALILSRLGPVMTVVLALILITAGSVARGLAPPIFLLFAATAVLGLGVAIMQPAMPVLVARWTPQRVAFGVALYMNGMLAGEFLGAGLTLPLVAPLVGGSWRATLVVWSLPALAVAALLVRRRKQGDIALGERLGAPAHWQPRWRDPRVWQLGLIQGAASAGYFGVNAYMAPVLAALDLSSRLADTLFWFNAVQLLGSLLMIVLAHRLVGRRWPLVSVSIALVAGLILFASGVWLQAGAMIVGLATCFQLILVVSLIPRLVSQQDAGPLAAGVFAIGYFLGFVAPLAGGLLADVGGQPVAALVPLVVLAVAAVATAHGLRLEKES